jgi:hypothetical protein
MDFKGIAIYVSAIIVGNINELLTTGGLLLNIAYIGYQLYTHHKKNNE